MKRRSASSSTGGSPLLTARFFACSASRVRARRAARIAAAVSSSSVSLAAVTFGRGASPLAKPSNVFSRRPDSRAAATSPSGVSFIQAPGPARKRSADARTAASSAAFGRKRSHAPVTMRRLSEEAFARLAIVLPLRMESALNASMSAME